MSAKERNFVLSLDRSQRQHIPRKMSGAQYRTLRNTWGRGLSLSSILSVSPVSQVLFKTSSLTWRFSLPLVGLPSLLGGHHYLGEASRNSLWCSIYYINKIELNLDMTWSMSSTHPELHIFNANKKPEFWQQCEMLQIELKISENSRITWVNKLVKLVKMSGVY